MSKKILVVDDDIELCNLLKQCLGNEGYEVACQNNGKKVVSYLIENKVDLIILDVMLPEEDGFTVLRKIREVSHLPVLMLSAKGDEMNKVLGLRTGADDYLTKPFGLSELVARVESLLRRCCYMQSGNKENSILSYRELEIPQKVYTKKQIYNEVWEEDFIYDDNTIMALISRLRKKIEINPNEPQYIQTVWGIGYRFNGEV